MTNQPKTFICRGCGQPTTAHAEGCKMAPGAPRTVAPQPQGNGQTSGQPPTTGKRRISDRDPFVRPEYLAAQGEERTIGGWSTITVHDPNSHKDKVMPALTFTDGKTLPINATNLRALVALFNDDEAASIGQAIVLVPITISRGKKSVAIRRAATPAARKDGNNSKTIEPSENAEPSANADEMVEAQREAFGAPSAPDMHLEQEYEDRVSGD